MELLPMIVGTYEKGTLGFNPKDGNKQQTGQALVKLLSVSVGTYKEMMGTQDHNPKGDNEQLTGQA